MQREDTDACFTGSNSFAKTRTELYILLKTQSLRMRVHNKPLLWWRTWKARTQLVYELWNLAPCSLSLRASQKRNMGNNPGAFNLTTMKLTFGLSTLEVETRYSVLCTGKFPFLLVRETNLRTLKKQQQEATHEYMKKFKRDCQSSVSNYRCPKKTLMSMAQSYVGASVTSGKQNCVQARINEQHPQATYIHCMAHRVNLLVTDACRHIRMVVVFFSIIESLCIHYSKPSTRSKFAKVQKLLWLKIKELGSLPPGGTTGIKNCRYIIGKFRSCWSGSVRRNLRRGRKRCWDCNGIIRRTSVLVDCDGSCMRIGAVLHVTIPAVKITVSSEYHFINKQCNGGNMRNYCALLQKSLRKITPRSELCWSQCLHLSHVEGTQQLLVHKTPYSGMGHTHSLRNRASAFNGNVRHVSTCENPGCEPRRESKPDHFVDDSAYPKPPRHGCLNKKTSELHFRTVCCVNAWLIAISASKKKFILSNISMWFASTSQKLLKAMLGMSLNKGSDETTAGELDVSRSSAHPLGTGSVAPMQLCLVTGDSQLRPLCCIHFPSGNFKGGGGLVDMIGPNYYALKSWFLRILKWDGHLTGSTTDVVQMGSLARYQAKAGVVGGVIDIFEPIPPVKGTSSLHTCSRTNGLSESHGDAISIKQDSAVQCKGMSVQRSRWLLQTPTVKTPSSILVHGSAEACLRIRQECQLASNIVREWCVCCNLLLFLRTEQHSSFLVWTFNYN
ncbi:hypothetical protein PR048_026237 [Dryococelus australis]|uniref:DUF4371 domain-containing protein n=1 Tax=Dryococelus australis TaxID=614101 RepID=A0ABQ9GKS5_9NEOP|nr:hypothetical protein PR048_026237 [Dryococelus australis]